MEMCRDKAVCVQVSSRARHGSRGHDRVAVIVTSLLDLDTAMGLML